jgi:hypothetical protein
MVPLTSLVTPILLSAVLVFVASSLSHAVIHFHRADTRRLPEEDEVMGLLRRLAVAPGDYLFPRPGTRADMNDPAFKEKFKKGPVGLMTVLPPGAPPTTCDEHSMTSA